MQLMKLSIDAINLRLKKQQHMIHDRINDSHTLILFFLLFFRVQVSELMTLSWC